MAPFYRGWEPNLRLSKDDEQAIQAIYGESKVQATQNLRFFFDAQKFT